MNEEVFDPLTRLDGDLETLVLSLLALAEVAEDLAPARRTELRELSDRLDSSGANLLDVSDAMRLILLSELHFPRFRENYLLDLSPIAREMANPEGTPSHGVQGLGPSPAALATVARRALRDPVAFAHHAPLLARLAALVGLAWPRAEG